MAPALGMVKFVIGVEARMPAMPLEQRFPMPAATVGEYLALQVEEFVRSRGLAYFPPLEYFNLNAGVDPGLLGIAHEMSALACHWIKSETRARVAEAFSDLRIEHVHCPAFLMPGVRLRDPNRHTLLSAHYSPDVVREELFVALLVKGQDSVGLEQLAGAKVRGALEDSLSDVKILAVQRVA